ncbi:uncharacterized protein M421DRAFT_60150 [Didymella exigua CBS 183.55]|uniref:Nephrocystin 3-like N-terminal domain-containing protein n=1 Tax=Didymella exigua CBS 183.55 TaxID=1150837 RepID=A0A6A5RWP7_9PLEO|nr:uncharacterized protein M421DRAFT_60150 [Didymella exigua CBS 183.55]KAF1929687.1 hypothetical protein M421DRAFT_60150 [Didymella exigua CBS 183.55]
MPAVGLAQSILLLVDFSIRVLQKQNSIYQPADSDSTPVVENAQVLQRIVDNLFRLTDVIELSDLRKLGEGSKSKLSEPAQQLLKISEEARELTNPLIEALLQTQAKGSFGDPRWGTAREALCASGVWKERDVTGLKKKLRVVRREVDVALLLALRQYLDQSAETGLPVFSETGPHTPHWEKWQNEALDAVHINEWKPKSKKNVEEFSKQVDSLIQAANEAHFCDEIFGRLNFEELDHRLNSIAGPHEGTLEWVFDDQHTDEGGVLEWLGNQRGEHLFWITGRPGAGKTTLMRHLFQNDRIFDYLEAWSGHAPGITSGFFFWNCGTKLQKSGLGLLRSLLYESLQDMIYGPLEEDMGILQRLFADRWEQFRSYGGGLDSLSHPELRRAFEVMISDASKKFLFMVDGLDEIDDAGDLVDAIPMLINASKKENVKVLVSSRPSPAFQEAFDKRPRLWVDDHTTSDVHAYILHSFSHDESLLKLRGNAVVPEEMNVVTLLSETCCGIFLWGMLATKFLLQELTGNDNFTTLQNRAEMLPSDLDELLSHILSNFEPIDLEQAWKISVLIEAHGYPSLLPLSFALSSDEKASISAHRQPLKTAEIAQRIDDMQQMLTYKCRNLFAIFDTQPPEHRTPCIDTPEASKVTYAHRSIRAFFLSAPATKGKLTVADLDTACAWAASHLLTLKTLTPPSTSGTMRVWPSLAPCLEAALQLHARDNTQHMAYTTAALGAALAHHTHDLPCFPGPEARLGAPLDLAVFLNLQAYVAVTAPTLDRKTIRRALDFSAAMRRRVGVGGEAVWLGSKTKGEGRGLERLRAEYAKSRGEMEAVCEYYVQAVRWGKKAPVFEVGEVV